ncbi:hypothetical protein BC835DRAFT_1311540 [Cytidiella melzeri]|nr:hypothetical protein BC835DRAFT_1311540 [Cytidiella melzeri]
MSSCATKGNTVATKGNSVATKRNSVLTGKKLRPLSNKTRVFARLVRKRTTTHLLVALADIAMNPFPETQGIEEEVKHNKVDGDGEEGNKESEEVEEIGAPRDQDRDKGVASVEGKLDDIYIYRTNRKVQHFAGNTRKSFSKLSSSILPHKRLADDGHVESAHSVVDLIANCHQLSSNHGWRNRPMAEKIAANLSFERLRGNVSGEEFVAQFICVELHTEERFTLLLAILYDLDTANPDKSEGAEVDQITKSQRWRTVLGLLASKEIGQQSALSRLVLLASSAKKACAQSVCGIALDYQGQDSPTFTTSLTVSQ